MRKDLPLLVVAAFAVGCGGSDEGASTSSGATSSGATSSGSSSSGSTSNTGGPNPSGVPTSDFGALNAWLQSKAYLGWRHESKPHASTGPHGGQVQTYVNDLLDGSLAAKSVEHPAGAASVKELHGDGTKLTGWAVMVKTAAKSDGGEGWYWYEVFDVAPGASGIGGQGSATCTGCHARGKDFVRIPYPLQ